MKAWPKAIGILALVLFGTLAGGSAMAQHRGHGGHGYGHGYGHGANVRFGVSFGVPIYGLGYYPAPYYAYPAPVYAYPVVQASPPVYIEQGATPPVQTQVRGDWYYCAASGAYYPYVAECPAGWQRVPAQPTSR